MKAFIPDRLQVRILLSLLCAIVTLTTFTYSFTLHSKIYLTMQTQTIRHAWFSLSAANAFGTVTYRGVDGSEVIATFISSDTQKPTLHADLVYKGPVTDHIRGALHKPGKYPWKDFGK